MGNIIGFTGCSPQPTSSFDTALWSARSISGIYRFFQPAKSKFFMMKDSTEWRCDFCGDPYAFDPASMSCQKMWSHISRLEYADCETTLPQDGATVFEKSFSILGKQKNGGKGGIFTYVEGVGPVQSARGIRPAAECALETKQVRIGLYYRQVFPRGAGKIYTIVYVLIFIPDTARKLPILKVQRGIASAPRGYF